MKITQNKALLSMLFLTPIGLQSLHAQESTANEELPELEMFIAEESAAALNDSVLPTDRAISGLFNDATSVLEVPRSVTLISPELMDQFGIEDLDDLSKIGAGTQTVNYYGVAGAPTIRGVKGGTFINGMLRAYNRNEMPLSFGSLEAIEVVKGPAPADFTTTKIGGFVNLIPKSPFFDEEKGSIKLELDNWGRKTLSADYGAPFLLPGNTPAAYRVSITTQDGESYYDDIYNDYTSVYGAIKFRPKDGVSVFLGGEYFDYKSNENAGWNRPTQELIDDGEYVIGEPLNATSGDWYGTVDRGAMYADTRLALTSDVAIANIDPALLGFMEFVTDTDGVDKYVYTQDYFDNGGEVVTKKIDGSTVLSDPGDFANSNDLILFGDVVFDSNPDRTITVKGLFEHMETEKNSSYGYAFESEQDVVELKTTVTERALIPNTVLTYGASVRYSEAMQLSDYWDEPFSRRDITQDNISSNTIVMAGGDSPIGGYNQWGRFGIGANGESEMTQLAAFLSGQSKLFDDRLILLGSTRYEYADYDVGVPSVVDGPSYYSPATWQATKDAREADSGDTDFFNWSVGFNFELIDDIFLYANYQEGTSISPSQAGVISSSENFQENNLWEVGVKSSFFEGSLFTSLAYYEWEQSSFSSREATSNTLQGEGVEAEITWLVTDHLTLIGSYTWQEVRRMAPLGYRTGPASEEDWALGGGTLFVGGDPIPDANPDLVYPGTPQQVVKLFGIYDFHNGFQVNGGVTWQEEFYTSFDHNIELPSALISSLGAKYTTEKWEVAFNIDNLTDEDYYYGSDPTFGANTLTTKAPERTYTVSFKYMF